MKLHHIALAGAPFLAFMLASTAAHASGLYVRADLGQTVNPSASVGGYDIPLSDDSTYAGAIGVADAVGPFRLEAEARKINSSVGGILDANATVLFANAYFDVNQAGKLQPFVGAGLGYAKAEAGFGGYTVNANGMAWQAVAGVGLKLSDNLTGELAYHYIDLGDLDFGLGSDVSVDTQAFTVGLRAKL